MRTDLSPISVVVALSGTSRDSWFDSDTGLIADAEGRFRASIPERWRAAAGPHGGYLTALVLRGLLLTVGDESRAPLTLTIQFVRAAEFGPALLDAEIERVGRSLTSASARLTQHDEPVALALATFTAELDGLEYDELPMPQVESPWPDRRSAISEQAPRFARNLVLPRAL